jgi:GT2 family glycosyltransferase
MKEKIIAVVLTRNRKKLLLECLNGLLNQSRKPNKIIIIDNHSTDGTEDSLKKKYLKNKIIDYKRLVKNMGPSGGFNEGIKMAYEKKANWVWVMDDDSEPQKDCLQELINANLFLKKENEPIGFLASCVYSPQGNIMNLPKISNKISPITGEPSSPQYLDKGLIKIENATFVSVFFSRDFIRKKGYPIKEMFIWGDDTEYTYRASKDHSCFLVGKSKSLHKKTNGKLTTILEENRKEIVKLYYLFFRNNMYAIVRYESKLYLIRTLANWLILKPLRCLISPPYGIRKARSVFFGTLAGLFFRPKIEVPKG